AIVRSDALDNGRAHSERGVGGILQREHVRSAMFAGLALAEAVGERQRLLLVGPRGHAVRRSRGDTRERHGQGQGKGKQTEQSGLHCFRGTDEAQYERTPAASAASIPYCIIEHRAAALSGPGVFVRCSWLSNPFHP